MATKKSVKRIAKNKACDCAKVMDDMLKAGYGAQLVRTFNLKGDVPNLLVRVEPMAGKKRVRLPTVLANCCPFCGKKYPEA